MEKEIRAIDHDKLRHVMDDTSNRGILTQFIHHQMQQYLYETLNLGDRIKEFIQQIYNKGSKNEDSSEDEEGKGERKGKNEG